jgi:DnaK suppressor protein
MNDMETFRQQLLELGHRLEGDVGSLADKVFRKTYGEAGGAPASHTVEESVALGSDNYDDEVTIGLLEKEGPRLREINAALKRIDIGTYSRCTECGQEISLERLEAIPFTQQCIECGRSTQGAYVSAGNL